jgi:hypothetical protein
VRFGFIAQIPEKTLSAGAIVITSSLGENEQEVERQIQEATSANCLTTAVLEDPSESGAGTSEKEPKKKAKRRSIPRLTRH